MAMEVDHFVQKHVVEFKLHEGGVNYLDRLTDKTHKGTIVFKANRGGVGFVGLNLYGIMPETPSTKAIFCTNRCSMVLYDEDDGKKKVAEIVDTVQQSTIDSENVRSLFDEGIELEGNKTYRLEFEFGGPKRRYGNVRGASVKEMYFGRAGTVSVEILDRKGNGIPLVEALMFKAVGIEQMARSGEEATEEYNRNAYEKFGLEAMLFKEIGFYEKLIEEKVSKGKIRFRMDKRIELFGLYFFGIKPKDVDSELMKVYKLSSICIRECDGICFAMEPEKWDFTVPADEKVVLAFIKSTLLAPNDWYTMEFVLTSPALRFGKDLTPVQEVDCGEQGKVTFEIDVAQTTNVELVHSFRFFVSDDQSVGPAEQPEQVQLPKVEDLKL